MNALAAGWGLDLWLVAELLLLGSVAGFLAGLLGVGGGMMMVPLLTWMFSQRGVDVGPAVKMAIATSMATILFTSLSSVRAHWKLGQVRWDLVSRLAPGILLGGLAAGAGLFAVLKGQGLALVFAGFIGLLAVQMLLDKKPAPGREVPGAWGCGAVGAGIGLASGLVGAGGAFLSVPFMTWCNVPARQAVGTASALGFPIAAASVAGYVLSGMSQPTLLPGAWGWLHLPALAVLSMASVTLAPFGARAAQRMPVARLKRVFACLLLVLAASMLHRGLQGG